MKVWNHSGVLMSNSSKNISRTISCNAWLWVMLYKVIEIIYYPCVKWWYSKGIYNWTNSQHMVHAEIHQTFATSMSNINLMNQRCLPLQVRNISWITRAQPRILSAWSGPLPYASVTAVSAIYKIKKSDRITLWKLFHKPPSQCQGSNIF